MNSENAVISTKPRAFLRATGNKHTVSYPIRFTLVFLIAFLVGMLFYAILSPRAADFSCLLLVRFEESLLLDYRNLPQNFLQFFDYFRWEIGLLAIVFLSSVTILAPVFGGAACFFRGILCGTALAHALSLFRIGLLHSPIFLAFLVKEALFCAMLILFSARSSSMFERFLMIGWHQPFVVCREICSYFLKILVSSLSFLALCAMLSIIL